MIFYNFPLSPIEVPPVVNIENENKKRIRRLAALRNVIRRNPNILLEILRRYKKKHRMHKGFSGVHQGYSGIMDEIIEVGKETLDKFKCDVFGDEEACKNLCFVYKDLDTCKELCEKGDRKACVFYNTGGKIPTYPAPTPSPGGKVPIPIERGEPTILGMKQSEFLLLLGAGALLFFLLRRK